MAKYLLQRYTTFQVVSGSSVWWLSEKRTNGIIKISKSIPQLQSICNTSFPIFLPSFSPHALHHRCSSGSPLVTVGCLAMNWYRVQVVIKTHCLSQSPQQQQQQQQQQQFNFTKTQIRENTTTNHTNLSSFIHICL